jgi:hypothetical protein
VHFLSEGQVVQSARFFDLAEYWYLDEGRSFYGICATLSVGHTISLNIRLAKTRTLDTSPALIYAGAAVNCRGREVRQFPAARS